jgi:hypothetical protein
MATSLPPLFPIILYRKRNIKIARVGAGPLAKDIFLCFYQQQGVPSFLLPIYHLHLKKILSVGQKKTFLSAFYSAFEWHSFPLIL